MTDRDDEEAGGGLGGFDLEENGDDAFVSTDPPGDPGPDPDAPGQPSRPGEPPGRTLSQPDLQNARFGTFSEIWRLWRHHRKRRRLASEGYVQWYLIDDTFPTPRFVQPELKGGGIAELEHDGVTYLFPRRAMVASEQQGLWTVIHKRGEAEPINLREPSRDAIKADEVKEFLEMRVTSSPPSWLDGMDLDASQLLKLGLGLIVVYAVVKSSLGNGVLMLFPGVLF
jgi:hypothetical protein